MICPLAISVLLLALPLSAQIGFDFRQTASYVTDNAPNVAVTPTTLYPTSSLGVTYGWAGSGAQQGRDRSKAIDPSLAGINFVQNGSAATFAVDLQPAQYDIRLALGDVGSVQCWNGCTWTLYDGTTQLFTVTTTQQIAAGMLFDASGNLWSAAKWPQNNVPKRITLSGTRLTLQIGVSGVPQGPATPLAYFGVAPVPNFTSGATYSVPVGGTGGPYTITISSDSGFVGDVTMSAFPLPAGVTVSFDPAVVPSGEDTTALTVSAAAGTLPGEICSHPRRQGGHLGEHDRNHAGGQAMRIIWLYINRTQYSCEEGNLEGLEALLSAHMLPEASDAIAVSETPRPELRTS